MNIVPHCRGWLSGLMWVCAGLLTCTGFQAWAGDVVIKWVGGVGNSLSQRAEFYGSKEAIRIAETVLLNQRHSGGWPKNYDRARHLGPADKEQLQHDKTLNDTMFDNGATHSEVRYLAKVYSAAGDERLRRACLRGVEFMLKAQYDNGGWPQQFPDPKGYARHITFNDGAMIGVMETLRDISRARKAYAFVDPALRDRCAAAVAKGIDCILRCQIEVHGRKTAWCAQHDARNLAPVKARSYELPSISGAESVGIVRFLMGVDAPSPAIKDAIQAAVRWFEKSKLTGIRQVRKQDRSAPKGWDTAIVEDPAAPPMWARFYDISSNTPIFCSRDGVPRQHLADISYERRNGYSWLGYYPAVLLAKDYPAWLHKWCDVGAE